MTPRERRKKAYDNLPNPKPPWETFKRLLGNYGDPEEARIAWMVHWGLEKSMKNNP